MTKIFFSLKLQRPRKKWIMFNDRLHYTLLEYDTSKQNVHIDSVISMSSKSNKSHVQRRQTWRYWWTVNRFWMKENRCENRWECSKFLSFTHICQCWRIFFYKYIPHHFKINQTNATKEKWWRKSLGCDRISVPIIYRSKSQTNDAFQGKTTHFELLVASDHLRRITFWSLIYLSSSFNAKRTDLRWQHKYWLAIYLFKCAKMLNLIIIMSPI